MALNVGDVVRLTATFTVAATGAAVDPTTVTCTVTAPSGTSTTYTYAGASSEAVGVVSRSATGVYVLLVSATASEWWYAHWVSTGTGQAAERHKFHINL